MPLSNILNILKLELFLSDRGYQQMAYNQKIYRSMNSNEYEYTYAGDYGAKGETRGPRRKATPEQIAKQNQKNKEKYMRRLIKLNFIPGDYWITLKYPEGKRKSIEQVKKDFSNFIQNLRRRYKKSHKEMKYIYRLEIGEHGGIHLHIILNRIRDIDLIVQKLWSRYGNINFETVYEYGGYEKLANYIVKKPDQDNAAYEQLTLLDIEEQKAVTSYSCSRNLIRPVPEVHTYTRRTVEKLIINGPKPSEGYYIDQDSIVTGVNQYTGMSYLYYTECRIKEIRHPWEREEEYVYKDRCIKKAV